mmetsp:Transcript_168144/g.540102  ORF Transcript_168144/g.540102 Transcript_168144/m.540102 type:complete len:266 (+) Transcript_168144:1219-2016(+)
MLPKDGPMPAGPEVEAHDTRRGEEVPTGGPEPRSHRGLLTKEKILQAGIVRHLPQDRRGGEGEARGPEQSAGRHAAQALNTHDLAANPQEAVGGPELLRADGDRMPSAVQLGSVRPAGLVVLRQRVARGVACEDGPLRGAAPELRQQLLVPALHHAVVAVQLQVVVLLAEQLLLNQRPGIARTPGLRVVQECRPHSIGVLAQVQQEATLVFFLVHLPADPNEYSLGMLGLAEEIHNRILALRVPIARDAHEDRRPPSGNLRGRCR